MSEIISYNEVEKRILKIREQSVLLDRDVAELYEVLTKEINQAVSNNPDKFPENYVITLSKKEKSELVKNFDRFNNLKHSSTLPKAFTEKGLYMLATILKSKKATETSLAIVETFSKMREFVRIIDQLPEIESEDTKRELIKKTSDIFAEIIDDSIMETTGDEISLELDFVVLKVKRTIKREKRKKF